MQAPACTLGQAQAPSRIGANARIWLALVVTLVLHALLLLLPLNRQMPLDENGSKIIQVLLIGVTPKNVSPEPVPAPSLAEEAIAVKHETPPIKTLMRSDPFTARLTVKRQKPNRNPVQMSVEERNQRTHRILASPYITEESVTEQLFGNAPARAIPDWDFHYPGKEDMISMLNTPLPDLPFDFTQGLIKFSYEPGVMGEMQRFFDVITPEFGWTTRYGTKVDCVWVLIIVACGWGR